MKYKRLILILSFIIILFSYIVLPYLEEEGLVRDGFKKDLIRFHIRANSDLKEDQDLKLKIRDEILRQMGEDFKEIDSINECRIFIQNNLNKIKAIAEGVIYESGKDYPVEVSLGYEDFPIRKYGDLVLPQGEYEALVIEIGEARGQNWWCVMFPPLCFVDITHSMALATDDLDLEGLNEFIIDESQPLKVRSLILDFIKKLELKKLDLTNI